MGDITGFLKYSRQTATRRPVEIRKKDYREVYNDMGDKELSIQGARCMDCGIPFCHDGCPLGNLIPEFNDFVYKNEWENAFDRLHATNNFPDFTGRLCPAPCEGACVLGINSDPVAIKQIELSIVEHKAKVSKFEPVISEIKTGKKVAIVGSGPSGLAAAQQLVRAGHEVTVYERGEKPGGLLRYGIPEFKMEKSVLDRRLDQLIAEGVNFECSTFVTDKMGSLTSGVPNNSPAQNCKYIPLSDIKKTYDAVLLTVGSTVARDLNIKGRNLKGIHFAMDYLKESNLFCEGSKDELTISAKDKDVIIIGGGDTGADCLGTAIRQEAKSIFQLEIMPEPPLNRPTDNPWPTWPLILRTSSAHEEGGERLFSVTATEFVSTDGINLSGIMITEVRQSLSDQRTVFENVLGTEKLLKTDLVLLAMGFVGPELNHYEDALDPTDNIRGNFKVDSDWRTKDDNIFAAGDAVRGQSLIVWAIAEGRSAAYSVDRYLMGYSNLPIPLKPYQYALR
jgi:glutamate synthase (NADPH/NADH) small chain